MTNETFERMAQIRNEWSIKGLFKKEYALTQESEKLNSLNNNTDRR